MTLTGCSTFKFGAILMIFGETKEEGSRFVLTYCTTESVNSVRSEVTMNELNQRIFERILAGDTIKDISERFCKAFRRRVEAALDAEGGAFEK